MGYQILRRIRSKRPVSALRRSTRLELERLEDRTLLSGYQQHNLVAFQPGVADFTDPRLNGWGLAFAPDGPFWVADTGVGLSTVYDHHGKPLPLAVTIPAAPGSPPGAPGLPTGAVFNPTSEFVITENGKSGPALFIFDTIDGTIRGWNPAVDPTQTVLMVDKSTTASYFGLEIGTNSKGQNVLYAADGNNNRIDMFGGKLQSLGNFTDPKVASQFPIFAAYGVHEVDGRLYVTFVGPPTTTTFGGVVDVFDTDGHLLTPKHFAANDLGAGPLASPWGIVRAPSNFGEFSNDILIGNVEAAGNINAFDPSTGRFLGQLKHPDGTPIAIAGLWDLDFGAGSKNNGKTNELFFTAGVNAVAFIGNGLFGKIHAGEDDDEGDGQGGNSAASTNAPALLASGQIGAFAQSASVLGGQQAQRAALPAPGLAPEYSSLGSGQIIMTETLLPRPVSAQVLDDLFARVGPSLSDEAVFVDPTSARIAAGLSSLD